MTAKTVAKTSEVEDTAPAESTEDFPKGEPVKHVKYAAHATRRVITEADWASVGAEGQEGKEWNFENDFLIPLSEFSDEAVAYLRRDGRFTVVSV